MYNFGPKYYYPMEKLMIFKTTQDIIFDERDAIKVVGLKVRGGAGESFSSLYVNPNMW